MKTITWEEFISLCNTLTIVFQNDDGEELVRAADEFGVDLHNLDTCEMSHFTRELNETIDVDGNDITLMEEDYAVIISVFDVTPHLFK